MRRLLVPVGLFLVIAILGLLFLPHETLNPPRTITNGSSMTTDSKEAQPQVVAALSKVQWASVVEASSEDIGPEQGDPPLQGCEGKPSGTSRWVVDVPVATLWSKPNQARPLDQPGLENPVQMSTWLQSMSISDKLWLVGKLETQALLGTEVALLDRQGDWLKVAVLNQSTPRNEKGYPGWVPKDQIMEQTLQYDGCPMAIVSNPTAWLYEDALSSQPLEEISFNTELPIVQIEDSRLGVVRRENEILWLNKSDIMVQDPAQSNVRFTSGASGEQLVQIAQRFLKLPYLWAGTSGFGFDCSGFTYAIHRFHGIAIPRDAKDQANGGIKVENDDLLPGDLLFYAYDNGKGKVHHVAMYIGEGLMIHSPKTERSIEIISISTPAYAKEFAGARRYTDLSI